MKFLKYHKLTIKNKNKIIQEPTRNSITMSLSINPTTNGSEDQHLLMDKWTNSVALTSHCNSVQDPALGRREG